MNTTLLRDLGAWEAGELASQELLERHGEEAAALAAMHERLSFAALQPGPGTGAGWVALEARLEDRPAAPVVRLRTGPRRRVLLAAAAVLMLGGTALAVAGGSDEPALRSTPLAAPDPAGGPGAFRAGAEPIVDKVKRHPTPEVSSPAVEQDDEASSGDATSGSDEDHQGTHPGKGNEGTDNGNDSDPDSDSDPDPESDPDPAEDDEGEPGDFGKGGKVSPTEDPEQHEKPASQGKSSPPGKPSH